MQKPLGLFVLLFFLGFEIASAANVTIEGKVRDMNTHNEISFVNIFVKDTQIGTSSDFSGRFSLTIPDATEDMQIVFQHISYDPKTVALDEANSVDDFYLQPRVIPFPDIQVGAKAPQQSDIKKDLPQTVAVLESETFQGRGFTDAGDLLRTDHSVQVEEDLSGKKTLALRGGNPDEVIVLYDGVKMNSTYDNVFDFSLIDVEDVDRFEIIKGSNTALYGSEAFSGVVNIVPKIQQDYNIRFQQRFGTYNSGNWGLHLYQNVDKLHASYSFKQGGVARNFTETRANADTTSTDTDDLTNTSDRHNANVVYSFSKTESGRLKDNLSVMYIRNDLDYKNRVDYEQVSSLNQLISARYEGDIGPVTDLDVSFSRHWLDESQSYFTQTDFLDREIEDLSYHFRLEKGFQIRNIEALAAYQYQDAELDYQDIRDMSDDGSITGLESATLSRQHHGFVAIGKLGMPSGSEVVKTLNFDLSLRYDRVTDEQTNSEYQNSLNPDAEGTVGYFGNNEWDDLTVKFATHLAGYQDNLSFSTYLTYGTNVKFPTLFQQISQPNLAADPEDRPSLNPEKNTGVELSAVVTRDMHTHPVIYGVQFTGNYIQNHYDNKFRVYYAPGSPVAYYDNVVDAKISGLEGTFSLFMLRKKLTLEMGYSHYFISEKLAFPFKSEQKQTVNLILNHAGYSVQVHGFHEGDQIGIIRRYSGDFDSEVTLPGYSNMDVHVSKTLEWDKLKLFANFSVRNLLDNDEVLEGLAIRDRRFYLTFGAQY